MKTLICSLRAPSKKGINEKISSRRMWVLTKMGEVKILESESEQTFPVLTLALLEVNQQTHTNGS